MISVGLLFWLLMILTLIFGWIIYWPTTGTPVGWRPFGYSMLLWILLALLGLGVFGWPIRT